MNWVVEQYFVPYIHRCAPLSTNSNGLLLVIEENEGKSKLTYVDM